VRQFFPFQSTQRAQREQRNITLSCRSSPPMLRALAAEAVFFYTQVFYIQCDPRDQWRVGRGILGESLGGNSNLVVAGDFCSRAYTRPLMLSRPLSTRTHSPLRARFVHAPALLRANTARMRAGACASALRTGPLMLSHPPRARAL
jgi:hypothetical protein